MSSKTKILSFYIITYVKDGTEKSRTEKDGINAAYATAQKKVKALKEAGATLQRSGTRGAGRVWIGKLNDSEIKVEIKREQREVNDDL